MSDAVPTFLQFLTGPLPFPLWSFLIHLVVTILLLLFQNLLSQSKTTKTYKVLANEFLGSVAWLIWSFENVVIAIAWSRNIGLFVLTLRLFLAPRVLNGAYTNPCAVVYQYLRTHDHMNPLPYLIVQHLAIPVSIVVVMATWTFLAESGLSHDHEQLLAAKMERFISLPLFTGFVVEALVSFLVFLPNIFLWESSVTTTTEVLLCVFLIYHFGPLTGTFMNPMVALASQLMWHSKMDALNMGVHFFILWVGPLVGTIVAVGMAKLNRTKH